MKKHRDHRELGRLLELFSFEEVAPGAPFWLPKGMIVFRELEKLARQINDLHGYQEISTPILVKSEVFKKSGHWQHYRDNMFYFKNPVDEKEELVLKPMNCPESTYVYNAKIRSYRDLPLRLAEMGRLHRNELSGTLGGLLRVRQIIMDDAHIYCRPEQFEAEIRKIIEIMEKFYGIFDFKPDYILANRPKDFMGEKDDWDKAEEALKNALDQSGVKYKTAQGEGAFYGPKVEVHLKDSQERFWQMGTAQLDLVLPKQFDVYYVDEKGKKQRPWVIHRAIFGSFERFIGVFLEHTDGNLPVWLAPVQAMVLNISDKQKDYAEKIFKDLMAAGVRAELNIDNATIGKKIREAEVQRIPYIVVVGEKEEKLGTVSVRNQSMKLEQFLKKLTQDLRIPLAF